MVRGAVARVWHRHLFSLAMRTIATGRFTPRQNVADTRVLCAVLFVVSALLTECAQPSEPR